MSTAPPDLHEDSRSAARDAAARWGARSRAHAVAGDVRRAALAQWASDVAVLHRLLWDSGLGDAFDAAAQLDTIARVVHEALARTPDDPQGAAATVTHARTALGQAFGSPVDALLGERFQPLDHLTPGDAVGAGPAADARRGDRTGPELVRDLREVATDCAAVARAMTSVGLVEGARDQLRRGQLAALEAFLVSRALASGDNALLSADLRWDVAMDVVTGLPAEESADPAVLADHLVAAVGPGERRSLREQLAELA